MRPLSFTKNLGGFKKAYDAIRAGYSAGVTTKEFRTRCGLGNDLSLLVTEFLLGTQIREHEEYVLGDTLIAHTLSQPYSTLVARLYFFALNLNMPGERLRDEQANPAQMQNTLVREHLYVDDGFRATRFDKDSIQSIVGSYGGFKADGALRKWVNNYSYMKNQCEFVSSPDGQLETFSDTWGLLALRLFFERYAATNPNPDVSTLVTAAMTRELHKLIGVSKSWLDKRIAGAAEMFVSNENYMFLGFTESGAERRAAEHGVMPPEPQGETKRREALVSQIIRRGDNRRFLQTIYDGECQLSGVKLIMPDRTFSIDCAHIRPLGIPHRGEDSVGNMLSLSPTMHRLFDRGCVRIDPETLAVSMLYGNDLPHRPRLLVRESHIIQPANLAYHSEKIIG